jgi:hypothetical protein
VIHAVPVGDVRLLRSEGRAALRHAHRGRCCGRQEQERRPCRAPRSAAAYSITFGGTVDSPPDSRGLRPRRARHGTARHGGRHRPPSELSASVPGTERRRVLPPRRRGGLTHGVFRRTARTARRRARQTSGAGASPRGTRCESRGWAVAVPGQTRRSPDGGRSRPRRAPGGLERAEACRSGSRRGGTEPSFDHLERHPGHEIDSSGRDR